MTACMSVNYCLSRGDTTPGIGSGMGYLSARAGNRTVNYCLSVETPLSAKLTSPLSGAKLFIAKFIKYFPPLKGRGGGVSRRRGLIPWIIVEF